MGFQSTRSTKGIYLTKSYTLTIRRQIAMHILYGYLSSTISSIANWFWIIAFLNLSFCTNSAFPLTFSIISPVTPMPMNFFQIVSKPQISVWTQLKDNNLERITFLLLKIFYKAILVYPSNKLIPEHTLSSQSWCSSHWFFTDVFSSIEQMQWPFVWSHMVPFLFSAQDSFWPHLHTPSACVSPGGHGVGSLSHLN